MDLPYQKVEHFEFNGQSYPTEDAAIRAAVAQAIGNPGIAGTVLREACALAPLLARYCQLHTPAGS
jgi:hypothetical protein